MRNHRGLSLRAGAWWAVVRNKGLGGNRPASMSQQAARSARQRRWPTTGHVRCEKLALSVQPPRARCAARQPCRLVCRLVPDSQLADPALARHAGWHRPLNERRHSDGGAGSLCWLAWLSCLVCLVRATRGVLLERLVIRIADL
mgnify:CR=1 FL=1|jgi:hypothetical protein